MKHVDHHVFVGTRAHDGRVVEQLRAMGMEIRIEGDSATRGVGQMDGLSVTFGPHPYENEPGLEFEAYRFEIHVRSLSGHSEQLARKIFEALRPLEFPMLLTAGLDSALDAYSPRVRRAS